MFTLFETIGFAARQRAVATAGVDALLLGSFALVDARHGLGGSAAGGKETDRKHCVRNSAKLGHAFLDA
jgi:hypothetical protein